MDSCGLHTVCESVQAGMQVVISRLPTAVLKSCKDSFGTPTGPLCLSSFVILAASALPAASFAGSQTSMLPLASPAAMIPSCMQGTACEDQPLCMHKVQQDPRLLEQEWVFDSSTGEMQCSRRQPKLTWKRSVRRVPQERQWKRSEDGALPSRCRFFAACLKSRA